MISQSLLLFALSAFLSGGNVHGVVVNKTFRPLPGAHSLGVNGIYRLELREADQAVHRQMVSRAVFVAYEIGDEFDDRVAPEEARRKNEARRAEAEETARLAQLEKQRAEEMIAQATSQSTSDKRLVRLFRRQDMLPETEGF
jgi:hypothetical protein